MGCAGGAGYLGDSHCMSESIFPPPALCVPTKLRAELFPAALQTPSPGLASRHTRAGETDPCLAWTGDRALPPTCHARHCPDMWHWPRPGFKCLSWTLTSPGPTMNSCC